MVDGQSIAYTVSAIGALSTLLVGSGAVSFFLRYSTRLTMLETSQADVLKANLHVRVLALEQAINEIKSSMGKLGVLDSMNAKQEMMLSEIRDLRAALVPRAEHQARWEMLEEKLNLLESKLLAIRNPKKPI
jgi:hypothetical protein